MLYETSAVDPWAVGLSLTALLIAALLESLLPVRKAASVDPMQAYEANDTIARCLAPSGLSTAALTNVKMITLAAMPSATTRIVNFGKIA
jgi:hypothetical protein